MMETRLRKRLEECLSPSHLEIEDCSHLHQGHAGHRPGTQTHFNVTIVSNQFENLKLIERHQRVYEALSDYMNNPIHALSLKTLTPAQFHALS